jgi:8-oxo-dGTP pyrophosphatase MutT (NUDIX family)
LSADASQRPTLKLRSAGLIRRQERVLLHRWAADDFWALPGGTIEPGELSDQALCREIEEELDVADARAVRLLWVVENRFLYLQQRFHEIGFYWLLDVPERDWPEHGGEFRRSEPNIVFWWAAVRDLPAINIKPAFLREAITALPATTTHLQVDDA